MDSDFMDSVFQKILFKYCQKEGQKTYMREREKSDARAHIGENVSRARAQLRFSLEEKSKNKVSLSKISVRRDCLKKIYRKK